MVEGTQYGEWTGAEIIFEDGHIKIGDENGNFDGTDLYNRIMNIEYNGVTFESKMDELAVAIGDGNCKFSFRQEGHAYCFEFKFLIWEEISAYQTERLSMVIGIHIVKEQMKNYFSAEQVESFSYFQTVAAKHEWTQEEIELVFGAGVALALLPVAPGFLTSLVGVFYTNKLVPVG